ncbi:hypothetical protein CLCR_05464 [Cladophialophora carrionii]|uniref:Heterokaryon incompatibility domain-containing protein n=1 Tax=Cladophialophora carrionii TaxID=86049 RepID=A0A1C1CA15_9EURO|nr:hypothetical protein CLCR_05464 [Cladophialophora carrionii]
MGSYAAEAAKLIQAAKLALGPEVESSPFGQRSRQIEKSIRQGDERINQEVAQLVREIAWERQELQKDAGHLSNGPKYLQDGVQCSKATAANGQVDVLKSKVKAYSSTQESSTAQTAKLATFRRCTCQVFTDPSPGKMHLSIKTTAVELHKENGVAISYTWGQFDRTKHCIGHRESHPTEYVWIELGAEWRVNSVLERLVQFTNKYGACWIDQVCFQQKDEQIRRSLAQIPAIFRTLPVVIPWPGSLCSCLRKAYEAVSKKDPISSSSAGSAVDEMVGVDTTQVDLFVTLNASICLNSNGVCSWPYRIWTNQEYKYARSVTLVFADVEIAECCFLSTPLQTQLEKINDYSRLLLQQLKGKHGYDDSEALEAVRVHNGDFLNTLFVLNEHNALSDMQVAAFLLGETRQTADEHMAWTPWLAIIQEMISVWHLQLSASQPKDYVLSLFAESDFYDPPPGFQDLPSNMLLKDFLRQLRKVRPVLIPTTCPAGLFGISDETWSFDASEITIARQIKDVRHIYGMFEWWDSVASSTTGRLPLKLSRSSWQSCASKAQSFASWLARHDTMTGFIWFCNAVGMSAAGGRNRLSELEHSVPSTAKLQGMLSSDDPLEEVQGCRACLVLVVNEIPTPTDRKKATELFLDVAPRQCLSGLVQNCLQGIIERASATNSALGRLMSHCFSMPIPVLVEAVFEVVCEMLFLDVRLCRERGVRVILGEWHPLQDQGDTSDPRWAPAQAASEENNLSNTDAAERHEYSDDVRDGTEKQRRTEAGSTTCIGLVHWETFCQARAQKKDTITIALKGEPHIPFYEAVRTSSSDPSNSFPEYKVFGVWVPLNSNWYRAADIGAIVVDEDDADAFVV